MLRSGVQKVWKDRRDFDFLKSHDIGAFGTVGLPENFSIDAGMTMPDQMADGFPYGCTGYTQTDLCTDEDLQVYDPAFTYLQTPPYTNNQGRDMRAALTCIITIGPRTKDKIYGPKRTAYFNVRSMPNTIDFFDAVRLAIYATQAEKRGVSVATPWFAAFELPNTYGVVGVPSFNVNEASWHNWAIKGWKTIDGVPYLIGKSWQGRNIGDGGLLYFPREIFNPLMQIRGSAAFTISKVAPNQVQRVDLTIVQNIVSFIINLFSVKKNP